MIVRRFLVPLFATMLLVTACGGGAQLAAQPTAAPSSNRAAT